MTKKIPKSGDISVTVQMLNEFRDDLKYFFTSKFLELRADMNGLETRLNGVEATLSNRMDRLEVGFADLKSDVHHVKLLCETQNQQSQLALDGARHAVEEVAALRDRIDKTV